MENNKKSQIEAVYGELLGLLSGTLHDVSGSYFPWLIAAQFNNAVDELSRITGMDYSRFKAIEEPNINSDYISVPQARTKINALVKRLELEYELTDKAQTVTPPVLLIQQNQTINMNIIPIQQLINDTDNEDLKVSLNELREAVEVHKDSSRVGKILSVIMDKSWELFIKVLPYILEHMGKNSQ